MGGRQDWLSYSPHDRQACQARREMPGGRATPAGSSGWSISFPSPAPAPPTYPPGEMDVAGPPEAAGGGGGVFLSPSGMHAVWRCGEVGVLLPSGRRVIFLQSRDEALETEAKYI